MTSRPEKAIATLFLAIIFTSSALAQTEPAADRLRVLNNSLLGLHEGVSEATKAAVRKATNSELQESQSTASRLIAERAAALTALIQDDPQQALSFAFTPELLANLSAQFPDSAGLLEKAGTWQGALEYWIEDSANATSRSIQRMKFGDDSMELHFAGPQPPEATSGTMLTVTGVRAGRLMAVAAATVQAATATALSCSTTGAQNTLVLLANPAGVTPPITSQAVQDIFFATSTGPSLDGFWREASYGKTFATGDVYGWYTLPGAYSCTTTDQMFNDAMAAAAAGGVNFQNYTRLFFVFPDFSPSCGFSGFSTVGCSLVNTPSGAITASTSYIVPNYLASRDQGVQLMAHEGGHQLGLRHAGTLSYGAEALGPLGSAGTRSEYGDWWSAMGAQDLALYGAPAKSGALGWMANSSNYQVVQNSGTYTLQPLAASSPGLQALRIQRGTGNDAWLWLEYRQPLGSYDSTLSSALTQPFSGALIHYEATGTWMSLLDFTPGDGSWYNPALVAGQTWVDPYTNLSITMQGANASGLTVQVSYGITPCTHANPTVSVSPPNASVSAGGNLSYTVSVTNNDAAGCSASMFSLSSAQTSGWLAKFSAASLTLNPSGSASVTLTESVPASSAPGTYALSSTASSGSYTASGTANSTVLAVSSLTTALAIPASSYSSRQTILIQTTVLNSGTPAVGANVTFSITKPSGNKVSSSATTDSTGKANWSYRIGPKDPVGTYSVRNVATYNSQTATSNTAAFTVQ